MGWPVSASLNRTVVSSLAGGQAVPVRAERHVPHGVGVTGERCADRLAGVRVPQPHVGPSWRRPGGARRGERHTGHGFGVPGQGLVRVPEPDPVVDAGGNKSVPVGAERDAGQRVVCPVSGGPRALPVSAFHNRTVLSALAEARR